MGGLLQAFRKSRQLQIALPISILIVAAIVAVAILVPGDSADATVTFEDGQELVAVRYGTFAREIPVEGRLSFPLREALTFDSNGVVGEILVSEGQQVRRDDVLATFDPLALARLERAAAVEQLNLENADGQLDGLMIPNPVSVSAAETNLANVAIAADNAENALADVLRPVNLKLALAQQAFAMTQKNFDDATEALEDLLEPKKIDVSSAEKRVAAAKVEVDDAQEDFDDIKEGFFPEDDVRDFQNAVDFARTNLSNAEDDLEEVRLQWDNSVRLTGNSYDEGVEVYLDVFRFWLGIELTDEEIQEDQDVLFETWGVDVGSLFERFGNPLYATARPVPDASETRWSETTIWAWLNLHPGYTSVQGTCDESEILGPSQRCIEREFEDAFDVFDVVRDDFTTVSGNASQAISSAQDAVTAAEDAFADALDDMEDIADGPDDSEIEDAEKRLDVAQANLAEAEEDLAELVADIDPVDIARAEADVAVAKAALDEAEADLLRARDKTLDIQQARRQFELAQANLNQAQVQFENARELHARDIDLAEANVSLAQAAFNDVIDDLDGSIIRAPFDGVVSLINVEVDDEVNDESRVVEVIDPSVAEVVGFIDAANREFVRQGSPATVTIAALQGRSFNGTITSIAPEPKTERGVISFPVTIGVDIPNGTQIPVALTSVTTVVLGEETGVIIAPDDAISLDLVTGKPVAKVMRDGAVLEQPVIVGDSYDGWNIVYAGLLPGDQVIVTSDKVTPPPAGTSIAVNVGRP